jgi:hypothetical protein
MSNRHGISRWHFLSQLATCSKIEQAAAKLHTVDTLYTSRIIKCGMDDIGMCIIMYILYMMYWDDATLSVHPKIFQTELAAPTREKNTDVVTFQRSNHGSCSLQVAGNSATKAFAPS